MIIRIVVLSCGGAFPCVSLQPSYRVAEVKKLGMVLQLEVTYETPFALYRCCVTLYEC